MLLGYIAGRPARNHNDRNEESLIGNLKIITLHAVICFLLCAITRIIRLFARRLLPGSGAW